MPGWRCVRVRADTSTSGVPNSLADVEAILVDKLTPFVQTCLEFGGHVRAGGLMFQKACVCLVKFVRAGTQSGATCASVQVVQAQRALVKAAKDCADYAAAKSHVRWAPHLAALSEACQGLCWTSDAQPLVRVAASSRAIAMHVKFIKRQFAKDGRSKTFGSQMEAVTASLAASVARWHARGFAFAGGRTSPAPGSAASAVSSSAAGAAAKEEFYDEVIVPAGKATAAPVCPESQQASTTARPVPMATDEPERWKQPYASYVPIKTTTVSLATMNTTLNLSLAMLANAVAGVRTSGSDVLVENMHQNDDVIVEGTSETCLYVRNCHSSRVVVSCSQIKYVCVEDCNKLHLQLDSASDGVDVLNARSIVITVAGPTPYFDVDRCVDVIVTAGAACLESVEIYSLACVGLRVARLAGAAIVESVVPSQFVSKYSSTEGRVVTTAIGTTADRASRQGVDTVRALLVSRVPSKPVELPPDA